MVLRILWWQRQVGCSWRLVLVLVLVLISAFCSDPLSRAQASLAGILLALGSNLCYAVRNVGTKYFTSQTIPGEKTKARCTYFDVQAQGKYMTYEIQSAINVSVGP